MKIKVPELVEKVKRGDRVACARAISVLENEAPEAGALIKAVFPSWGKAARIGVTGAPGSGKSSLVNFLARRFRDADKTVGIIAVDPSSPYSGGALLGDRIRMTGVQLDQGVFIRSLATRGSLGGLAKAADDVALVFDASGKDAVIFETVGVGQSEVDIAESAETTLLVLTPDAGDAVQTLKAGVMEIADVFVVNKADKPGADRIVADIRMLLDMNRELYREDGAHWLPPIVRTVSTIGEGIEELYEAISRHREHLEGAGLLDEKRRAQAVRKIRLCVESAVRETVFGSSNGDFLETATSGVIDGKKTPIDAAGEIIKHCFKGEGK